MLRIKNWTVVLSLPITTDVTLGRSLPLSGPLFPHLLEKKKRQRLEIKSCKTIVKV